MAKAKDKSEPRTKAEWQEAVDAAKAALCLDAARQFGFITGGPEIDQERCLELLDRGEALGVTPSKDVIEKFAPCFGQEHRIS